MKSAWYALVLSIALTACNKDSGDSSSGGGGAKKAQDPAVAAGTLAVVSGEILPAEGADPSTVAGALVQAEGKPEVSAVTDENGKFLIENVLPGQVALYVGSNDGVEAAALTEGKAIGPTAYGLKIPEVVLKSGEVTELGQQALKKTGGLSGKVLFYSNPNKLDLTGSEVFMPGTGFIVKTDANGAFSLSGLPPGKYDIRAQHTGFSVLDVKGLEVPEGETADIGNLSLSLSTGPEGAIAALEDVSAKIGGNPSAKIVKSRTVKLKLSYDSDAALMKVADEPSFTNIEWKPVQGSVDWTFKSDGKKTLYVQYSDLNGLESSPFSDDVIIDTEPPTLTSVTILNSWEQTATRSAFGDIEASDTGSGVAQVMYRVTDSATAPSFGNDWSPFKPRIDIDLGTATGVRKVHVKVIDFAGRESTVESDSINRGDYTLIANQTYSNPIKLLAKQSPYRIDDDLTFDSDLEIEEGSRVVFDDGTLTVKGVFTAVGTDVSVPTKRILFENLDPANFGGEIILNQGKPGTSEKTRIKSSRFDRIEYLSMNGGRIENSKFTNSGMATLYGKIEKRGKDPLYLLSNEFDGWHTGVVVYDGNGSTTIEGSIGNVSTLLRQQDNGRNTILKNNNVETNTLDSMTPMIELREGSIITDGTNVFTNPDPGTTWLTGLVYKGAGSITVDGLDFVDCDLGLQTTFSSATLTMKDSRFTCNEGLVVDMNASIVVENSYFEVKRHLVAAGGASINATFRLNEIVCDNSGGSTYCDLITQQGGGSVTATFDRNNLTCISANKCRGGFIKDAMLTSGAGFSVSFADNHWRAGSKVPVADFSTGGEFGESLDNATTESANIERYEFWAGHNPSMQGTWNITGDYAINASANDTGVTLP